MQSGVMSELNLRYRLEIGPVGMVGIPTEVRTKRIEDTNQEV
jgi:hypothetical protein